MKHCDNCGTLTSNPRFCCKRCSAQKTNKETPKRKRKTKCKHCDRITKTYRHTSCEEHFERYKERFKKDFTIGEYRNRLSVKGKHDSWVHSHIRNFARSWLSHLTKLPCAKCGYNLHVELCHIKPISSFPDDALVSEVNSERNVIQLCRNCHWEFDNLPRNGIFTKLIETCFNKQ